MTFVVLECVQRLVMDNTTKRSAVATFEPTPGLYSSVIIDLSCVVKTLYGDFLPWKFIAIENKQTKKSQ